MGEAVESGEHREHASNGRHKITSLLSSQTCIVDPSPRTQTDLEAQQASRKAGIKM